MWKPCQHSANVFASNRNSPALYFHQNKSQSAQMTENQQTLQLAVVDKSAWILLEVKLMLSPTFGFILLPSRFFWSLFSPSDVHQVVCMQHRVRTHCWKINATNCLVEDWLKFCFKQITSFQELGFNDMKVDDHGIPQSAFSTQLYYIFQGT